MSQEIDEKNEAIADAWCAQYDLIQKQDEIESFAERLEAGQVAVFAKLRKAYRELFNGEDDRETRESLLALIDAQEDAFLDIIAEWRNELPAARRFTRSQIASLIVTRNYEDWHGPLPWAGHTGERLIMQGLDPVAHLMEMLRDSRKPGGLRQHL